VLAFEGLPSEHSDAPDLLTDLAAQAEHLSGVVENALLLDELVRARRELETTFDSLTDLVAVCDQSLRCIHVNQAFAERSGRRAAELRGWPLAGLVGADTLSWLESMTLRDGAPALTRQVYDDALGGTFFITVTPYVANGHAPVGRVMVARDVTEQVKLEAERADLRQRLAQSEKLASLGQFVAGIAHELNNPLQAVLGHLELLMRPKGGPAGITRDLRLIYREADRAARIVRDLLVFGGSRQLRRRKVRLNAIVKQALAARARACRLAKLEIVRELDTDLPALPGDSALLSQAVLNLLINAEQAMAGTPGRIEVRTSREGNGDVQLLEVRDHGPGIPPEALSRLFEPFYTTKPVGQGTGLGLALAYGIVREHGGELSAANPPGGGARFVMRFPREGKVIE
jgi:PAS domain S-box-containing protein